MQAATLSDQDFGEFQRLLYRIAGISISPAKKALVCGRLAKRLKHHSLDSYRDYLRLLTSGREPEELQTALDLLTTNETYFFREPKHFDLLQQDLLARRTPGAPFRVWSAACSSGEEPFSLAMVLADRLGEAPWEILASDISTRVLERARSGLYAMERARHIPERYLKEYCLKGVGSQEGRFLVDRRLRTRVRFQQINLNETLPQLGEFDVVFLRNVMIYFNTETKAKVVERIAATLKPGGHLLIGHSESLNGVTDVLAAVRPSVYRNQGG